MRDTHVFKAVFTVCDSHNSIFSPSNVVRSAGSKKHRPDESHRGELYCEYPNVPFEDAYARPLLIAETHDDSMMRVHVLFFLPGIGRLHEKKKVRYDT